MKSPDLRTIKDYKYVPNGSCLYILRENKLTYRCQWTSMMGTYLVTIPKKYCIKYVPTQYPHIKDYENDPKIKRLLKRLDKKIKEL